MNKTARRIFDEYISDKETGAQFTVYDVVDYFKFRAPKFAPCIATIGRLVKGNPRVKSLGYVWRGTTVYEVIA